MRNLILTLSKHMQQLKKTHIITPEHPYNKFLYKSNMKSNMVWISSHKLKCISKWNTYMIQVLRECLIHNTRNRKNPCAIQWQSRYETMTFFPNFNVLLVFLCIIIIGIVWGIANSEDFPQIVIQENSIRIELLANFHKLAPAWIGFA